MVEYNVNGKVAVVTGGTRGLGLNCAEIFALNGAAAVIITSRKEKACIESKKYLEKVIKDAGKTCRVVAIAADIANEKECLRFYEEAIKQEPKIDIVIANAGTTWGAPLEEHPVSAIKKVLDLNIVAVFQTIQLFTPQLEASATAEDPSRVLIMSSIAGINPQDIGGTYGYLASKAGVSHMGRNLAMELGPRNITVNVLAPGFFPTKMSQGVLDAAGDIMIGMNPRQRLGVPEDIQNAALFLCAKQSGYLNGIVLPIDGGSHLGSAKL